MKFPPPKKRAEDAGQPTGIGEGRQVATPNNSSVHTDELLEQTHLELHGK